MDDLGATAAHDGNGRDPPHDDVVAESTTIVPLAAKDVPEKPACFGRLLSQMPIVAALAAHRTIYAP